VAALVFYQRLFELDPALRPLFRGDIEQQGAKLMQMLSAAVRLLDRPESLVPVLEDLGRRHVGYGVTDAHYETVGNALLWMFAATLGKHFTAEARNAWTNLYSVVAETMQRAANEATEVRASLARSYQTAAAVP
jgi:hemoglobin-like flavoprotein